MLVNAVNRRISHDPGRKERLTSKERERERERKRGRECGGGGGEGGEGGGRRKEEGFSKLTQ